MNRRGFFKMLVGVAGVTAGIVRAKASTLKRLPPMPDAISIRQGLISLREAIRQRGLDPLDVLDEYHRADFPYPAIEVDLANVSFTANTPAPIMTAVWRETDQEYLEYQKMQMWSIAKALGLSPESVRDDMLTVDFTASNPIPTRYTHSSWGARESKSSLPLPE